MKNDVHKQNYAFPSYTKLGEITSTNDAGLTKREYFAGLAMQGLMTAIYNYKREYIGQMTPEWISECALKQADGLIKALAEEKTPVE